MIADCEALVCEMTCVKDGGPVGEVLLAMLERGWGRLFGREDWPLA
jgi:hypothetical protein